MPNDRPVVMLKGVTNLKAPVSALIECSINFETRKSWDKNICDFKIFEANPDKTISRVNYTFKSPIAGVSDRDFYLLQLIKWDYPTKGAVTMHVSSL